MADHHPRSSGQQEADAAASKGCGMFDFLKKKPEDVPSSEENKEAEKPSLAERLIHLSDSSSSSDEEAGENGETKEKKKKKKKEKACGHNKEDAEEKKGIMEKIEEKLPAAKGHDQANKPEHEDGKEKGFTEKLPGGDHGKPEPEPKPNHDKGKERGFMEKIKEKLPGHTKHDDDDDEKKKET